MSDPTVCLDPATATAYPTLWSGDVVVAGGGSAGCAAAVAAARSGARTLLVEKAGFLGGTGAAVLDTFYGFFVPGPSDRRVVGGIGWEVCERLLAQDLAFTRPNTYGAGTGVTYEPDQLKLLWDDVLDGSGADVLLHAAVSRVVVADGRMSGLIAETTAGPRLISANSFVDATGDAELAWRAGCAVERSEPGRRRQPLTTTFRLMNVDVTATPTRRLHELMAEAAESGDYDLPRREGSVHRTLLPGVVHTNLTRVSGVDPTDPFELSRAERDGRAQVAEYLRFLVDRVPGYAEAELLGIASRIGVRESRRLRGRYVLDRHDVLSAQDFDDAIAYCGAPLEDHDGGAATKWEYIGETGAPTGDTYAIPYRCLLPVEVESLLVAGRCLSATHDAHASVRSMAQCMAMGQAAGTAAAAAAAADEPVADIDVSALRGELKDQGVLL